MTGLHAGCLVAAAVCVLGADNANGGPRRDRRWCVWRYPRRGGSADVALSLP